MKSSPRGRGTPPGVSPKHSASRGGVSTSKSEASPAVEPRSSPLWLPALITLIFAGFLLLPRVNAYPNLVRSFLGAAACLIIGLAALWLNVRRTGRSLIYEFVPRRVHWVQ